jgi:hypothetical protein
MATNERSLLNKRDSYEDDGQEAEDNLFELSAYAVLDTRDALELMQERRRPLAFKSYIKNLKNKVEQIKNLTHTPIV